MQPIYLLLFGLFALPAAVLEYADNGCFGLLPASSSSSGSSTSSRQQQLKPEYLRFRNNYVLIFSLMMAGDWLQGPYVYHLYEHYGFSVKDIGRLFIMGFGASAVLGTIAGTLADSQGRKRAALLYVATYAASCVTKHSADYWVLMLGRLLGGVATSLLFSAFEAWAVAAHTSAGFEDALLADLFTKAVFLGNGVMAIASGLAGNLLVEGLGLGPVAPFDAAIAVLLVGGAAIALTWRENYGTAPGGGGAHAAELGGLQGGGSVGGAPPPPAAAAALVGRQFRRALHTIQQDARVALLGASQALFEASMYTFVFLWTPALSPAGEKLPHGFIFAIFMTASMVGTAAAGRLMRSNHQLEVVMQGVFCASAVCLAVPVVFHLQRHPDLSALKAGAAAAASDSLRPRERLFHISKQQSSQASSSQQQLASSAGRLLLSSLAAAAEAVTPPLPADSSLQVFAAAAGAGIGAAALPASPLPSAASAAAAVAGSSSIPAAVVAAGAAAGSSSVLPAAGVVQLVAFCVFEVLIGMFWPSMMTLRAKYVPEEQRSTIINVFRIPLNLFVCLILWKVSDFPLGVIFAVCSVFLLTAAGCQWQLRRLTLTGYMPLSSVGSSAKGSGFGSSASLARVKADKNSADGAHHHHRHGSGSNGSSSSSTTTYKVVALPTSPTSMV